MATCYIKNLTKFNISEKTTTVNYGGSSVHLTYIPGIMDTLMGQVNAFYTGTYKEYSWTITVRGQTYTVYPVSHTNMQSINAGYQSNSLSNWYGFYLSYEHSIYFYITPSSNGSIPTEENRDKWVSILAYYDKLGFSHFMFYCAVGHFYHGYNSSNWNTLEWNKEYGNNCITNFLNGDSVYNGNSRSKDSTKIQMSESNFKTLGLVYTTNPGTISGVYESINGLKYNYRVRFLWPITITTTSNVVNYVTETQKIGD